MTMVLYAILTSTMLSSRYTADKIVRLPNDVAARNHYIVSAV
jgi:hypothetical protein